MLYNLWEEIILMEIVEQISNNLETDIEDIEFDNFNKFDNFNNFYNFIYLIFLKI